MRRRIYGLLEQPEPPSRTARVIRLAIMALILTNVVAVLVETCPGLHQRHLAWFSRFEAFSVAVFTIEYLLRLGCCVEVPRFARPGGRLRFALTPLALIDLVAILPALIPMAVTLDLRTLRLVRMVRLFRLLKLSRYSRALRSLWAALSDKREEVLVIAFVLVVLVVIASSLMYFVENEAQPDKFSSIPAAMWWSVMTMTTVGYGDVYPVTALGKLLAALISVFGVGLFAMPAAIWGAAFIERLVVQRAKVERCPHCGEPVQPGGPAEE